MARLHTLEGDAYPFQPQAIIQRGGYNPRPHLTDLAAQFYQGPQGGVMLNGFGSWISGVARDVGHVAANAGRDVGHAVASAGRSIDLPSAKSALKVVIRNFVKSLPITDKDLNSVRSGKAATTIEVAGDALAALLVAGTYTAPFAPAALVATQAVAAVVGAVGAGLAMIPDDSWNARINRPNASNEISKLLTAYLEQVMIRVFGYAQWANPGEAGFFDPPQSLDYYWERIKAYFDDPSSALAQQALEEQQRGIQQNIADHAAETAARQLDALRAQQKAMLWANPPVNPMTWKPISETPLSEADLNAFYELGILPPSLIPHYVGAKYGAGATQADLEAIKNAQPKPVSASGSKSAAIPLLAAVAAAALFL